jgi:serine/threonine protein kinase
MGDFPEQWEWVRDLPGGAQGHTFVVRRSDKSDSKEYVLKRLINLKRQGSFNREIEACTTLSHPNVLQVLEHGLTPKGRPFLITEYCTGDSLEHRARFDNPRDGLRFFERIVRGVAYAHAHQPQISHLDLKPENILLKADMPVVGDFGICFIADEEVNLTSEGQRGSRYYCAPELRGPKITSPLRLTAADVYSLGKILYWLFTGEVRDGHEEEYGNDTSRRLASRFPSYPQFALIDQLISSSVRRIPSERISDGEQLLHHVRRVVERIEAGGRVLDLRNPQRCLYCAEGHYRPAHDQVHVGAYVPGPKFPEVEERRKPDDQSAPERSRYATMRKVAGQLLAGNRSGIPLLLICDHCGNVQYFRLDLTPGGRGENWLP